MDSCEVICLCNKRNIGMNLFKNEV